MKKPLLFIKNGPYWKLNFTKMSNVNVTPLKHFQFNNALDLIKCKLFNLDFI
jgi:hypothetical protein